MYTANHSWDMLTSFPTNISALSTCPPHALLGTNPRGQFPREVGPTMMKLKIYGDTTIIPIHYSLKRVGPKA